MVKTAIVILFYNKAALTRGCINSVLLSGHSQDIIHVFDNGSEERVYKELYREYPQLNWNRIPENRGFSGGFNAALDWVFSLGYEGILFLTNDTYIRRNVLSIITDKARETGLELLAPLLVSHRNPERIDSNAAYYDERTYNLGHYKELGLSPELVANEYIPGTALFITSEAFYKLGGTDESYFMYWEDVDMCFRAHRLNIRMGRCEEAIIEHGIGKTCHKKPIYTTYYYQRNRIMFAKKHLSLDQWARAEIVIQKEIEQHLLFSEERQDKNRLAYWREIEEIFESLCC